MQPELRIAAPVMNPPPTRTEPEAPDRRLAQAILDSIVEAIFVFDPATRLISGVNHGATELLGRDRTELVGHRLEELLPMTETARLGAFIDTIATGQRSVSTLMTEVKSTTDPTMSVELVIQRVELPDGPEVDGGDMHSGTPSGR